MPEPRRYRRTAVVVAAALALIAGLFGLRQALAEDPLARLRAGVEGRSGSWWFPRGGPYRIGFDSPDGIATLVIDGRVVREGRGRAEEWRIYEAGVHAVTFRGPRGARLLWLPPGRRGQLEYVPASSLSPEPPERARFTAPGRSRADAAIAAGLLLVIAAAGVALARPRVDKKTAMAVGGVFALAAAVRLIGLSAAGQTWDEDEYWTSGRNYLTNLLSFDFRDASWLWNRQHPPVTKYVAGLGALWSDGLHTARALFALLGAGACALVAASGARLFGLRAGVFAGVAAAFLPHLVAHSKVIGHETPSVFFWALAVWLALRAHDENSAALPRRLAWVGVALGLAVATRFTNLLLAPVVGIALLARAPRHELVRTLVLGPLITAPTAAATFFAIWPRMWSSPIRHLDEAWNVLKEPHTLEPYLGAFTNTPGWHYFPVYLIATTPVVLLAAAVLLGAWRGAAQRGALAWVVVGAWLLAPFGVAWSPVRQDGVRYVLPALLPLCLAAGAGLDQLAGALRHRRAPLAVGAAFGVYLAIVCARIHPYYLDYYGEHVGGPAAAAQRRWFEVGWWGEGIGEAVDYVNRHAAPGESVCRLVVPNHTTWFRGDIWTASCRTPTCGEPGRNPMKNASIADWIIINGAAVRDGTDARQLPPGATLVHEVRAQGATLARVYRRTP